MTWLDPLLLLFFLVEIALGLQRGFAWGMVGLVRFFLLLGTVFFLAPFLARYFPFAPREWVTLALALLLALLVGMLFSRFLRRLWPRVILSPRLETLDHLLGIVPGLLWGALGAALILWVAANWGALPPHWARLHDRTAPCFDALLDRAAENFPAFTPEGWEVHPGTPVAASPSALEREMLALVNRERTSRGLRALQWDGRLAAVGRAHSRDMLARNYFDHRDPRGHDLGGRLRAARVPFLLAGENLAFAPTLLIAHRGLMQSPGHRANILRPPFRRLGIGIVRIPPGATYRPRVNGRIIRGRFGGYLLVTQVFAR